MALFDGEPVDVIAREIRERVRRAGDGAAMIEIIAEMCAELAALKQKAARVVSAIETTEALQKMACEADFLFSDGLLEKFAAPQSYSTRADAVWDAANGFYALEFWKGTPFRWAGPETSFRFRFAIDRETPKGFVLSIVMRHGLSDLKGMVCRADGQFVRLQIDDDGWNAELSGVIPAQTGSKWVVLEFTAPKVTPGGGTDERMLSVGVHALEVTPLRATPRRGADRPVLVAGSE
jgi:hypothetical protein